MKKNLDIIEVENKTANNGKPYCRIKTNDGWMACFDGKANEALKSCVGQNADIEVRESKGKDKDGNDVTYHNIAKYYGVDQGVPVVKPGVPVETKVNNVRTMPKDPVRLAVELFNSLTPYTVTTEAGAEENMKKAIELVKQAQEAFS
jgi:hypothetical protein